MELAVHGLSMTVDQLECMGAVAVHVTVAVRDPAIAEQERDLVSGLGTQRDEIPEHVRILMARSCDNHEISCDSFVTKSQMK